MCLLPLSVVVRDRLLAWGGSLGLHLLAIHCVGAIVKACLSLVRGGEGDESESPGALGVREAHDHAVHQLAVLAKEGLEALLRRPIVEAA